MLMRLKSIDILNAIVIFAAVVISFLSLSLFANKGDVTVQDDQGTTTVAQGQQTTRDDTNDVEKKKKKRRRGAGAAPAAKGGVMSSKWAVVGGAGVVTGIGVWVWLQDEQPISPDCRTNPCR